MAEQIEQTRQLDFRALLFAGRSTLYVSEVAEKLRITEQAVRNLIEEGRLGAINIGLNDRKFWRIPVEEYERFLRKNFSMGTMEPTKR